MPCQSMVVPFYFSELHYLNIFILSSLLAENTLCLNYMIVMFFFSSLIMPFSCIDC